MIMVHSVKRYVYFVDVLHFYFAYQIHGPHRPYLMVEDA